MTPLWRRLIWWIQGRRKEDEVREELAFRAGLYGAMSTEWRAARERSVFVSRSEPNGA